MVAAALGAGEGIEEELLGERRRLEVQWLEGPPAANLASLGLVSKSFGLGLKWKLSHHARLFVGDQAGSRNSRELLADRRLAEVWQHSSLAATVGFGKFTRPQGRFFPRVPVSMLLL